MTETQNYKLNKPAESEYYDVNLFNSNADIIDAELKKAEEHRNSTTNPHKVTAAQVGASNPNLLINGGSVIDQYNLGECGMSRYVVDRWFQNIPTENCCTAERFAHGMLGGYYVRLKVKQACGWQNFMQFIEDASNGLSPLCYKTITFSCTAHSTGSGRGAFIGYVDSNNTTIWASTPIPSDWDNPKVYSITANIPINAHKVVVGIGNIRAFVESDINTYCDIYDCKLEIGSVPTPFVPRPYAEELALCQRYHYVISPLLHTPSVVYGESDEYFQLNLPVGMRTIPTFNFGIEGTDWCVCTMAGAQTQSGFTLSIYTDASNITTILLKATKSNHGITNAVTFKSLSFSLKYLDAEIY